VLVFGALCGFLDQSFPYPWNEVEGSVAAHPPFNSFSAKPFALVLLYPAPAVFKPTHNFYVNVR